jgi:hypothetical protein
MTKGLVAAAVGIGVVTMSAASFAHNSDSFTPTDLSAAFGMIRTVDRDLTNDVELISGYAARYTNQLRSYASGAPAALIASSSAAIACGFGGSVQISDRGALVQTLTAVYSNCATRRDGMQTVANGVVQLVQLRQPSASRFLSIRFGAGNNSFVEQNQLIPVPLPVIPPSQVNLNLRMSGKVLERNDDGSAQPGLFRYVVDGVLSYDDYSLTSDPGVVQLSANVLNAQTLAVTGAFANGTVSRFESGSLTHDYLEQRGDTSNFSRRKRTFDDFQISRGVNASNGNLTVSYDGSIVVETSDMACANGAFNFSTFEKLQSDSQDAQSFTAGVIRINNRGTIRFSTQADGEALATLRVPGYAPVEVVGGDAGSVGSCVF